MSGRRRMLGHKILLTFMELSNDSKCDGVQYSTNATNKFQKIAKNASLTLNERSSMAVGS